MSSIIAIAGTTASGKTRLAIELAQALDTEVISADSQVVYQELDIGTAKPTLEERQGIPHHAMDCVPPTENYTVARYAEDTIPILERLLAEGKTPIVVGGTGFYLRALLQQKQYPDVPPDPEFREQMKVLATQNGPTYLHDVLQSKDPRRAEMLYPQDEFRIIRALEIIEKTGLPVPDVVEASPYDVLWIGLGYADRDRMRQVINDRIDAMVETGWLTEVETLVAKYGPEAHALTVSHGYPEWIKHINGELTFQEARDQIRLNIHQYARRQLTWFRNQAPISAWFDVDLTSPKALSDEALKLVRDKNKVGLL